MPGSWSERIRRHLFSEPWQAGCLFCLILGLGWYAGERQAREVETELRQRLLGQTVALAQTINPEDVAALSFTGADVDTPRFERMRGHLVAYGRLLPEARWVYTMAQRDGRIVFGPDNVAMNDPDGWDPPGTVYQQPPPGLNGLFSRHDGLILGPYTDEFGTYVSAFAPVIHLRTGEVVMLVAQDVTIERWQSEIWQARLAPVLPMLVLLLLLWAGLRAVAWRIRLPLPRQPRWLHLETGFTVVFGMALTAWLVAWVNDAEARWARGAFRQMAEGLAEPIRGQCFRVRDQLAAVARFVADNPALAAEEFRLFAAPMAEGLPVVALAWAPRQAGAGPGELHHAVVFVEPLAENEAAIGFDLASEPVRGAALAAAAASGLMTGSAPVLLKYGDGGQRGMLVFQAVHDEMPTATAEGAAPCLRGFAVAVLRLPTLFESALSRIVRQGNDQVRLSLLDLTSPGEKPKLLVKYPPGGEIACIPPLDDLTQLRSNCVLPLFVFGRTYALVARPGDGFMAAHPRRGGWFVGAVGLILTASVAIFVGFLRERRVSLDAMVRHRTGALRESEGRYRAYMDSTTDLAFIKDAQSRYLFVNRANQEFFDCAESEILGRTDDELMPAGTAEQCSQTDRRALAENRVVAAEQRVGERVYEVRKFPMRLPNGEVGIAGWVRDVTELRHGEERRQELERQLFHSQKLESLGLMASGIAHDFNNLLAAIQGNAQLAMLKLPPEETPVTKALQGVVLAAQNAAGLTRQLMAYSGKTRSEMQPVHLNALLADNAAMFRAVISKAIELNVVPAAGEISMTADPGQVQQVVMNLLTNAAEAMTHGHGAITLSAGMMDCDAAMLADNCAACRAEPGRYAWIEVRDTGCGMDAATRQQIFDPFFTTKAKGHGLGMSAMLGIIRHHRGAIFVDSEPGRGTTIRVLFPVSASAASVEASLAAAAVAETAAAPSLLAADAALSGTVLLIDDEPMFRDFCAELVGSFGCRVLVADGGEQGVALCRQHAGNIDCVLLDMIMPGMDGVAAFDALSKIDPPPPIIICSGLSRREVLRRLGSRQPAGFVQKPFDLPTVRAALAGVLARREGAEASR
jgi:PAS domain S-box-containing protein